MRLRAEVPVLDRLCYVLLIIGAINWGVIGLVDTNLVFLVLDPIFQPGAAELIARAIYILIGLAGLYFFYPLYRLWNNKRAESEATGS